jgi:pimeloyl-ACP methyl ester carboxylesterase
MFITVIVVAAAAIIIFAVLFVLYRDLPKEELENKYAPAPSKFIDIDGNRVHYRDEGEGPVLVLLHGIFSSLHTWDGWVKELSGKYRTVRLDLPGWGLTGKAAFEYSLEEYVNFLHKFLTVLDLKKIYLAGNSFGGQVAWNYSIRHPEMLEKLILIDPIGYPGKRPVAVKMLTMPISRYFSKHISPRFIIEKSVRETYGKPDRVSPDALNRYYELMFYPGSRGEVGKILDVIHKEFDSGWIKIKDVTSNTLIMWGAKDSWVPRSVASRFSSDIRKSKLIVYEDAGHIPMEEIPVETARDADRFLRE